MREKYLSVPTFSGSWIITHQKKQDIYTPESNRPLQQTISPLDNLIV